MCTQAQHVGKIPKILRPPCPRNGSHDLVLLLLRFTRTYQYIIIEHSSKSTTAVPKAILSVCGLWCTLCRHLSTRSMATRTCAGCSWQSSRCGIFPRMARTYSKSFPRSLEGSGAAIRPGACAQPLFRCDSSLLYTCIYVPDTMVPGFIYEPGGSCFIHLA